jgi:isopenicillin-N N-acyltransferase like protein
VSTLTDCQFPLITYKAEHTPYEWGLQHGTSWRGPINELANLRRQLLLQKNPALESELDRLAREQWEVTSEWSPMLAEEMRGISDGAKLSLTDIVILNNYTDFRDIQLTDEGCSTVHVQQGPHVMSGQTWDMHGSAQNYLCLIHIPKTDFGPESLVLSLVGCLGLMGINEHHALIGVNNINTTGARAALIWPALVRQCLTRLNVSGMRSELLAAPVTSGHNYMISDPYGGEHWEIGPDFQASSGTLSANQSGVIFHTNHCLTDVASRVEDKASMSSTTHDRFRLLEEKVSSIRNLQQFLELLQNHDNYPKSLCSHFVAGGTDPSFTCGGGVSDLVSGETFFWRGCKEYSKNYRGYHIKRTEGSWIIQEQML